MKHETVLVVSTSSKEPFIFVTGIECYQEMSLAYFAATLYWGARAKKEP